MNIFRDWEHERKSEILECYCPHPLCNGKYIQVYELQKTCLHTFLQYVDKSSGELDETWYNMLIKSNKQTMSYTPEQEKEINERVKRALDYLQKENLTPACYPSFEKLEVKGKDVFGVNLQPYLQDTLYPKV